MSDWMSHLERINNLVKDGKLSLAIFKRNLCVDLEYPRLENNVNSVQLGLSDVRAADDIRISYDFDRDGWKIEQQAGYEHDGGFEFVESDPWKEVTFISSWQLCTTKKNDGN